MLGRAEVTLERFDWLFFKEKVDYLDKDIRLGRLNYPKRQQQPNSY